LPASSKPTDRGLEGASQSPWSPSGTLPFNDWSYPTDARLDVSSQHPSHVHSSASYKQSVPVDYSLNSAVDHEGQATASQRPDSTRMSPAERTPRAPPPPQTLLAFRERRTPSNANQPLERRGGRRNESPTAFLSRILSEPRSSPTERRQISTKERRGDREIERSEMNGEKRAGEFFLHKSLTSLHLARLASSRWERGGAFISQPDRVPKSALAAAPAGASPVTSTQRHGLAHVPNAGRQMSSNPRQVIYPSSNNCTHPGGKEVMTPVASGSRYSTADPVSEPEDIGTPKRPQPVTSTNTVPVQARKILPVSRPRPQPTTYPIPTYPKPALVPGAKPLHSSSSHIPTGPCGSKRAQEHPEPSLLKRSKTLEDIKRVEEENKRLIVENKSIEMRIHMARAERLRQEAIKKAAQELQLRALELKNAKLKQDNMELKLQLERSTQSSDMREGSTGRSVAKALAEGPTVARLLPDATKVEAQMKLQLDIATASGSPRPVKALGGARLALEQMEVEIQSSEKSKNAAMVKARGPTRPEGKMGEDVEAGKLVKVEADDVTEALFTLDYEGSQEVDLKMVDF